MARMSPATDDDKTDDPDAIVSENDINHQRSPYKRNSRKVVPQTTENDSNEIFVEVKPKRILRVVHLVRKYVQDNTGDDSSNSDKWIHHGKNGLTIKTSAQINHNPSFRRDLSRADITVTQIDVLDDSQTKRQPTKRSKSFKLVSGVDNKGFDASEIMQKPTSSPILEESDSTDNHISSINSSQGNLPGTGQNRVSTLERSATTRNVDIELDNSSSSFIEELQKEVDGDVEHISSNSTQSIRKANGLRKTPSQDAVLFFIHGVGGSTDVWKQQLDYFSSEGYEIICPDLIGHGFSSAPHNPKDYRFEEISVDLLLIFDMFSKKHNVVIGHSYGCSFAAVIARQRQSKVNKMILISGGSPIPLAPQPGIFSLPTCALACMRPIISRGFKKSAFHSKKHISQDKAFDVPSYVLKYTMNGQWWPDGGAEYHQWIKAATLLIHGVEDKLVLIEEEEEMLESIFGSRMVMVDNASHMVMMEKADEVNEIIHEFLLQSIPVNTSMQRTSTRTREALIKKPWLRRALSKSKTCSIEPMGKTSDETLQTCKNGISNTGSKAELDRKGSSLSLRSVKSLPHDLVAGNLY